MNTLLLVFLGGGLGSLCRFSLSSWLDGSPGAFPWATFLANILACLVLGGLLGMEAKTGLKSTHKLLFATGFCGGFSTFSTFSAEGLALMQSGQMVTALMYVGCSIMTGLIAVYLGYQVLYSI